MSTLHSNGIIGDAGEPSPVVFAFPPVVGYDGLSQLLCRSVVSLQADRCRAPESVPPACTPPGTRNPLWLTADVLAWLSQFRAAPVVSPAQKPKRGRPTKALEIARRNTAATRHDTTATAEVCRG